MAYKYCLRYVLDPRTNTEKKIKNFLNLLKKVKLMMCALS